MTASVHAGGSDYAHADQEGKVITEDTVILCIKHPPWVCLSPSAHTKLYGLEPPSSLTGEFNRKIIDNSYEEVWEETNYEERYKSYLKNNTDAKSDLFTISALVESDDVCIVCQQVYDTYCTRRLVYEHMHESGRLE